MYRWNNTFWRNLKNIFFVIINLKTNVYGLMIDRQIDKFMTRTLQLILTMKRIRFQDLHC